MITLTSKSVYFVPQVLQVLKSPDKNLLITICNEMLFIIHSSSDTNLTILGLYG